jgi:thiamine-monophosphate kinase
MNEFEFISEYLSGLAGPEALELKDDTAVWNPPAGQDVILTSDTLVEGVHYPIGKFDGQIAHTLMAVNLSDLTAKGADPVGYLLNLTLSDTISPRELKDFCSGLESFQAEYGVPLWGGDTTRTTGPTVLSITMMGIVPSGTMVLRSGARPGDVLCVTGCIGEGYLGLKVQQKQIEAEFSESELSHWLDAYQTPKPPFKLRRLVRSHANAALDVSDGLIADAGHLAQASGVKLNIDLHKTPVSGPTLKWLRTQKDETAARIALATGGDDYQVLMSTAPDSFETFKQKAAELDVPITKIGTVTKGEGVDVLDADGTRIPIEKPGYTHF